MKSKILAINVFSLFTALYYATIIYYASVFLSKYIGSENVWAIYSFGALFTIIFQLNVNKLLHKININTIVPTISLLSFLNIILLYFIQDFGINIFIKIYIFIAFAIYIAFAQTLFMLASVMLEDLSKENKTGSLRGMLISMTSFGYLCGPFLANFILKISSEKSLFLLSSVFVFTTFIIFKFFIQKIPEISIHKESNLKKDVWKIWSNIQIRNILILQTAIEMFYAGFVIYFPLKLLHIGIPTSIYLGIIVPIAITAFIIIPPWIGHFEDKVKNEKAILFFAFLSLSIVVAIIAFSNITNIIYWTVLVFASRVCASLIEVSTSSYLFKKINVKDTSIITAYSLSQPIAYFISPFIFGAIFYMTGNFDFIFLALSMFLFMTIYLIWELELLENHDLDFLNIKNKVKKRII